MNIFSFLLLALFFSNSHADIITKNLDSQMNIKIDFVENKLGKKLSIVKFNFDPKNEYFFIMNHGLNSQHDNKDDGSARVRPYGYYWVSKHFVELGYSVIIPSRQGRAGSEGVRNKNMCNIEKHASEEAEDISTTVEYIIKNAAHKSPKIILAGESYGSVVMLAFLADNKVQAKYVKAAINFSGGVIHNSSSCLWSRERLYTAYESIGSKVGIETLWIYHTADELFNINFASDMFSRYSKSNKLGMFFKLHDTGAIKLGGHNFINWRTSVDSWSKPVKKYLEKLNLPVNKVHYVAPAYLPKASNFARIDDHVKIPSNLPNKEAFLKNYLSMPMPRVLVISEKGFLYASYAIDSAEDAARSECLSAKQTNCVVYAIDDVVLYTP